MKQYSNFVRKIKTIISNFRFMKISTKTLNNVQNCIHFNENYKQILNKKLRQNKFKLLFEFVVFVCVILLIGLHIFLQKINPNDFKRSIEKAVKSEFKIDLTIKGNIRWTIFKIYPAVELNNILINNIVIGSNRYSIELGSVKARISLLSLLDGTNIISKIHLKNISLKLIDRNNNVKGYLYEINKQKIYMKRKSDYDNKLNSSFSNLKFDIKEILIRNTDIIFQSGNSKYKFKVNDLIIQHILHDSKIILTSNISYMKQNIHLSVVTYYIIWKIFQYQ